LKKKLNLNKYTKASTLIMLRKKYSKEINVPELISIKKNILKKNGQVLINQVIKKFYNKSIIIRSSAKDEDSEKNSNAGKYDSFVTSTKNARDFYKELSLILKKLKSKNDEIIF